MSLNITSLPLKNPSYTNPTITPFSTCFAACQRGDLKQLQAHFTKDPLLSSQCDSDGQTLFYACAASNQLSSMHWLYQQNAQALKICRFDGQSLMHIAAEKGHLEIAQWLHNQNPSLIDLPDNKKLTPLHVAAFHEQIPILKAFTKILIANRLLVLQIAQNNCPKTLAFILEQGIDPCTTNSSKQTLLHLAAEANQKSNVLCLIQHQAKVNALDLSKRTPLFLAVLQGHKEVANLLIKNGADLSILNGEKESLLHAAAFYGHTHLLKNLLDYPACKNLVNAQDQDGKTPLHKAVWGGPKPNIVNLLLANGAQPNAQNNFGYTPLHWAAKHGHTKSAQLLLKKVPSMDVMNHNGHHPFDLAIRFNQDDFIHCFLGTQTRLQVGTPPSTDIEGFYSKRLLQAKKQDLVEEQILYLQKLSALYIEKENFLVGAKILNCVLALVDQKNRLFKGYLLNRLEEIEKLFLKKQGIQTTLSISIIGERRNRLEKIREAASESHQQAKPIQDTLKRLSREFMQLLSELVSETQQLLGPPPVKWAAIAMGSMSRGEMCPYSDIEFAFLIEKNKSKAFEYFRTLSRILELKVINLGETKFPVFGGAHDSPTPDGFCMDSAGNTPLGVTGVYELIGTPKQIAQFQSVKWMERNIILPNALSNVCLIAGDKKLEASYNKEKKKIQQLVEKKEGMIRKNDEELAMRLLGGHLIEFSPDLSKEKEQETAFGVKKELYRPFQEILGCLSLLYDLKEKSTFARIDELARLNVFCSAGADNLKKAINQVLSLRLQVHLFYKDEKEFLCHPEEGKPQDPTLYYFNEQNLAYLHEIYKVLLPFHKVADGFYKTRDTANLSKSIFYDDSPSVKAFTFERTLQYAKAHEAYQQAVSLNPNDIDAQLRLGLMEGKMGKNKEALPRNLKALALAQQKYGEDHPTVGTSYNNLGATYDNLGEFDKALDFYQKGLNTWLQVYGEESLPVATSYNNMGYIYNRLAEHDKALDFYQKALKIKLQVRSENHPEVAISYNNIGSVYCSLGGYDKALDFYKMALKIGLQVLGENHPNVATSYNNIGQVYEKRAEYDKALKFHHKALEIKLYILGENHPDVATSYNNIGSTYDSLGLYDKALDFYQKALKIQLNILDENHPDVATIYNNIGHVYGRLGEYAKAIDFYQKVVTILLLTLVENHPDVAISYNNIGNAHEKLGNYTEALELNQAALKIKLYIFGENHPDVATSYKSIGDIYERRGDYNTALEYYQKALQISLNVHGANHPNVAIRYSSIGNVYERLRDYAKALEFHQKALEIRLQFLDKSHPDLASSYNNIGRAYQTLEKYTQTLEFFQKAVAIWLQVFGENHPHVAVGYSNIGNTYASLDDYAKALEFHQKAVKIQIQVFDKNHSHVATSYNNIGLAYDGLEKHDNALDFYQKALELWLQIFGENHPDVATSYSNIGSVYDSLEDHAKSLEFHQKALKIKLQIFGENHPDVTTSYDSISIAYCSLGKLDKAIEFFTKALNNTLQLLGENHPDVASCYNNIGLAYEGLEEHDNALEFYKQALKVLLQAHGKNHPDVQEVFESLITCAKKASPPQVKKLQEITIHCRKILGEDNPLVQQLTQLVG